MAWWRRKPKEPTPVRLTIDDEKLVEFQEAVHQMAASMDEAAAKFDKSVGEGVRALRKATVDLNKAIQKNSRNT